MTDLTERIVRVETQLLQLREDYALLRIAIGDVNRELNVVSDRLLSKLELYSGALRADLLSAVADLNRRAADERAAVLTRFDNVVERAHRAHLPDVVDVLRRQWIAVVVAIALIAQTIGADPAAIISAMPK